MRGTPELAGFRYPRGVLRLAIILVAACGRFGFDDVVIDATACPGVTNGLLGYWPMEATDVVGTTVYDRSGASRHGTLIGAPPPVVTAGQLGDALDFTATTTAYVELPQLPVSATPGASTTVALWFWHANPGVDETLVNLPSTDVAEAPRYDLWLTSRNVDVAVCLNTGVGDCWGVAGGLIGRWVHIVAVFVNGRIDGGTLYIDGALVTATCQFGGCDEVRTVQAPFELGNHDPRYAWHGKLDEVRIYDRPLALDEVQQLYTCPR